ncbi:Proton-coupled amino acid transporter 4 [Trichostrongylus colubriformis]|uniref:Proton-coupled amino acid transporter 4 n=1 Tax=Trichostrongylus colubriformis TaxID=6319 RepID=A0AAN8FFF0_TRICO
MSVSSVGTMNGNELRPLRRPREPTMDELFAPRIKERGSISADQALIHMVKVMMGTGMLSLPLAFKNSGLWLGLVLLAGICMICIYCTRQLVHAAHYIGYLKSQPRLDYANVMRSAVEIGPPWIRDRGYFWKQVVNVNMFMAQFGFCCVYFVFMADNLKQFFDQTSQIHISQAGWIALLAIPIMALCTIRELKALAPLAALANVVYLIAVCIVLQQLFLYDRPTSSLPAVASWTTLPLFFGTVMFAFEGVAVVLPIENQMDEPLHFITHNGVLNTSCLLVLALYMTVGFFGYLRFGNDIMDTLTLNLPQTNFYQVVKLMFVCCILVSYPLQFYVPLERIEKWIKRKIAIERQEKLIYGVRLTGVLCTCLLAELIPHLALFISLVGSVAGTSLTLVFPPMIELLCCYSKDSLTPWIWTRNILLMAFAVVGFATGTYTSIVQIVEAFGKPDV